MDALVGYISQVAYRRQVANYVICAGLVLIPIDWLQTVGEEVRLIWPRRWSTIKVLYFFSRYLPWVYGPYMVSLALSPSLDYRKCAPNTIASSILMITAIAIAEAIMFIRVYALSQHDKRLGIWLAIQFLGVHVAIYVVLGRFLVAMEYMPSPLPQLVACVPTDTNTSKFSAVFAMIVASEAAIMAISLVIGFSRYRSSGARLITVFRRDGIFYFVTMACVSIANIIFDSVAPVEFKFMLMAPQGFLHSILSCRLILHMHQLAEEELESSVNSNEKTSIQFAREMTLDVASVPAPQEGAEKNVSPESKV